MSAIRQDPGATDGAVTDERFQAALTAAEAASVTDEESGQSEELFDEEAAPEEKQRAIGMSFIKFDHLKIFEKIRLATIGNAYCRKMLVRDSQQAGGHDGDSLAADHGHGNPANRGQHQRVRRRDSLHREQPRAAARTTA